MRGKSARSADGTEIYYERYDGEAQKPVLLFIHGVGGDLDAWQFVREPLHAAGYSTVALDVRGHGYSGHPRGRSSYGLKNMREDIAAVLECEGVEKAILVGHSGGAIFALDFAGNHPERLVGLVLIAGSVGRPRAASHPLRLVLARAGLMLAAAFSFGRADSWHSLYPAGKQHKEIEWWGLLRTLWHNTVRSYALTCLTLLAVDLADSLSSIVVPTLLIAAENDGVYPAEASRAMQTEMPNAKLFVVPGANHVLPLNEPGAVTAAIKNFL